MLSLNMKEGGIFIFVQIELMAFVALQSLAGIPQQPCETQLLNSDPAIQTMRDLPSKSSRF